MPSVRASPERMSPFFGGIRARDDFARTLARARLRQAEFAAAVG